YAKFQIAYSNISEFSFEKRRPDIDLRFQRPMNRAAFRNFEQPAFLSFIQVAAQLDFTIDAVQKALLRFTIPAILRMNPEMLEPDDDTLQIDAFSLRVQAQRHRCACAQTCEQEFIRRRSGICP